MAHLKGIARGDSIRLKRWRWVEMAAQAGATAGSGVVMETNSVQRWLFFNTSGALKWHTSEPTNVDSQGTAVGAVGTATLDQSFDQGTLIDNSIATGDGNAFSVGGAATDDKVEIYHSTNGYVGSRAGDLYLVAAGGDIVTISDINIDADNKKLAIGDGVDADSYLQWNATDLEIFSNAAIRFLTGNDTDDYMTLTTTSNVPTIGTTGSCDLKITASSGEIDFADDNLTTTGTLDAGVATLTSATLGTGELTAGSINRAAGSLTLEIAGTAVMTISASSIVPAQTIDTGQAININVDDVELTFGASGTTDSRIAFNGTSLRFYDSQVAAWYTLQQLYQGTALNPIVTGDLTISDGQFDWVNTSASDINAWTFSNASAIVFQIVADSLADADLFDMNADSITSGYFIHLDTNQGASMTGGFLEFISDGTTVDFAVKRYGEVEILGADNTDAITITKGHIQLEDGKIECDLDSNLGSYFKRNQATATSAIMTLENSDTGTGSTGSVLDINSLGTGNGYAVDIDHNGDYAAMRFTASAASDGNVIEIVMTNRLDEQALKITGNMTGANGEGIIDVDLGTGVLAGGASVISIQGSGNHAANSHLVDLLYDTGTLAAASADGFMLSIVDTSVAQAGSYMVYLSSTNNLAMHVDAGNVLMDDDLTVLGKMVIGADAAAGNDDFKFFFTTTNKFIVFDESADDVIIADATGLIFGGDESTADGVKIEFDGTATLNIDALTANDTIVIGATADTNMQWEDSASNLAIDWDAGNDTLTIQPDTWLVVSGKATGDGDTGLAIPYHATASPSANAKIGAIFFEVDANKLWVNTDGAGNWVSTTLA